MRAAVGAAAAVVVAGLAVLAPAPAYADGDACDSITAPDTLVDQRPGASDPVRDLQIQDAQDLLAGRGPEPGPGAVVAVLDSGISDQIGVRLRGGSFPRELKDWHGTAMAGVIAGPDDEGRTIGFAPGAELVDVRVYDTLAAGGRRDRPVAGGGRCRAAVPRHQRLLAADRHRSRADAGVAHRRDGRGHRAARAARRDRGGGVGRPADPGRRPAVRRVRRRRRDSDEPRPARTPPTTRGRPATTAPTWSRSPRPLPTAVTRPRSCCATARSTWPPRPPGWWPTA